MRSKGIISSSASYSGRKYGSTLACMSPGRKPRFSPASTAGPGARATAAGFAVSNIASAILLIAEAQHVVGRQLVPLTRDLDHATTNARGALHEIRRA